MATVDDKLKLFARIVFERVEQDSHQKVVEFSKSYDEYVENEKLNIKKQAEAMVNQTKKKAEAKKNQILSKANIDMQHTLLKKRKELFDQMVQHIRKLALEYTSSEEYVNFLQKCIATGLSQIESKEVIAFFKSRDIERYKDKIEVLIEKYKLPDMKVMVEETDRDILGGCIFEDREKTIRIDCSMTSIIEDNRSLIGKTLMENL